jgi:hypothetical protein
MRTLLIVLGSIVGTVLVGWFVTKLVLLVAFYMLVMGYFG